MKHILFIFSIVLVFNKTLAQTEILSGGSGGAFTLAMPANINVLTPGLTFTFKANQTSLSPSSLSVNGLPAVTIKKGVNTDLSSNDILAGQVVTVVYDGTNFQMVSASGDLSGGPLPDLITDADGDTHIGVEGTTDEDIIHFSTGDGQGYTAQEYFRMNGPRLEVLNSGASTFFGEFAGENDDLTANANTFFGSEAGRNTNTGVQNVAIGYQSMLQNTTGGMNVAIGSEALKLNSTGSNNIALGQQSQLNNSASNNISIGRQTLMTNTSGNSNIAIGTNALLLNSTGSNNVGIGHQVLSLATGSNNTVVGYTAGSNIDGGISNTYYGYRAGIGTTTGSYNTVLGTASGDINSSGANNTLIGYNAETTIDGLTNATAIGSNAAVSSSNSIVLGSINGINGALIDTKVGVGTTAPVELLDVNGGIRIGSALQSTAGTMQWDGSNLQYHDGSAWQTISTGAAAGGDFYADGSVDMTGQFKAIAGGTAAPGISFTGDNNTGLYQPAVDQIGLVTAGSEALRIDASGNIGINNGSPGYKLHLTGDARIDNNVVNTTAVSIFNANDGFTTSAGGSKGLMVGVTSSGSETVIGAELHAAGNSLANQVGAIITADGASSGTYNRGVVAMASNNPNSNFGVDVFATGNAGENTGVRIFTGGTQTDNKYGLRVSSSGSGTKYGVYTQGEDHNSFDGNVVIGNITPNAKLDLNGDFLMRGMAAAPGVSAPAQGKIYFDTGSGKFKVSESGGAWVDVVDGNGIYDGGGVVPAATAVALTDYLAFDGTTLFVNGTTNRVGVGTNNPTNTLDVVGNLRYSDGSESDGNVLVSDPDGVATWKVNAVAFDSYPSGGQSLLEVAFDDPGNIILFNVENFDDSNLGGSYDHNNYAFRAPVDGVYAFEVGVTFEFTDGAQDQEAQMALFKSAGIPTIVKQISIAGDDGTRHSGVISCTIRLAQNEIVYVEAINALGGGTITTVASETSWFSGHLIYAD